MPRMVHSYGGKKCSVSECKRNARDNNMCGMHAQRVRRYGDPEYVTSKQKRSELCRVAAKKNKAARPDCYLKFHGRHEHRVVMEKYVGRKLSRRDVVHHIDGDKHNNEISNLELTTQSEHVKKHWAFMMERRFFLCKY